jgi:hypothetical protein
MDEAYVKATGDSPSQLGRKVSIAVLEVRNLLRHLQTMGGTLFSGLEGKS